MLAARGITRSSVDEADAVGVSRWFVSALHILTTMVTRNSICWRSECRATPAYRTETVRSPAVAHFRTTPALTIEL